MTRAVDIQKEMRRKADKEKAVLVSRFFKTGKGEYGEGDVFLGLTVPQSREIAKSHHALPLTEAEVLLRSKIHEERFVALLILIRRYERGGDAERKRIYALYMKNKRRVNNWDLVDVSAKRIPGAYLFDKDRTILYTLAQSRGLWDRRIAIMSTFYFIEKRDYADALALAEILLHDAHDLIHKAVGWMLREVGNRDKQAEETFLKERYRRMPRTMLRYAIEKFPETQRKAYLQGMM